jgi:hypothetical protein
MRCDRRCIVLPDRFVAEKGRMRGRRISVTGKTAKRNQRILPMPGQGVAETVFYGA